MSDVGIDSHVNNHGVVVFLAGDDANYDFGDGIVSTGNTVTPGAILVKGTNDGEVVAAGDAATTTIGWALENPNGAETMGVAKDLRADFAAGDWVRYSRNPGDRFMGILADGYTVSKGDKLVCAAGGQLRPYVPSTSATDNDPDDAVVGTYGGESDVTTSGATARILVRYGGA